MEEETVDLSKYPTASGVYLMKDDSGQVLYVGKAKNLRARLRSYFAAGGDGRAWTTSGRSTASSPGSRATTEASAGETVTAR